MNSMMNLVWTKEKLELLKESYRAASYGNQRFFYFDSMEIKTMYGRYLINSIEYILRRDEPSTIGMIKE